MLELLRGHRDFRRLYIASSLSMFGDSALIIVMGLWVKQLTGSSALAGSVFLAFGLPALISPVAGYVVDRVRRRPFLIVVNVLSAAVILPMAAVGHQEGRVWIIYLVAFAYGLSMMASGAALNGLLKTMLPDEALADANGALQTTREGLRLVAPISGAGLFAVFGADAVIALDALTFLFAALALSRLSLQEPAPAVAEHHLGIEMAAGARFLWRDHPLRQVTLVCGVALLVVGFSESVCFAVVDVGLGRPPAFLGVLLSVQGVGAILGGLTASLAIRRFGEATAVGLGLGLFGTGAFLLGATGLPVVFVGFAVAGSGLPWVIVGFYTLMQRRTPSSLMGRVSAATDVLIGVPQTVSIGVGALLVAVVDYRLLLDVMAIVLLGCAAYLAVRPAQRHATPEQPADLGSTDVV